jgi:hypothetical protein
MSISRYGLAFLAVPVVCGWLACGRETSPFCPKGLFPAKERSVAGKTLWCESKDRSRAQWIEWHKGGTALRQSCSYLGGKPEGSFTAWHPEGKVWVQGQFASGQKAGKWKQWDDGGSEVAEGDYATGRLVAGAPVAAMADCEKVIGKK